MRRTQDRHGPKRLDGTWVPHTYHRFDGSLDDVAARYGTSPDAIIRETRARFPRLEFKHGKLVVDARPLAIHEGIPLAIPVSAWEQEQWWEEWEGGSTLEALCEEVNGDQIRTREVKVSPQGLFRYARNASVRSKLYADLKLDRKGAMARDLNPGEIALKGARVWVPYSACAMAVSISVGPYEESAMRSTADTHQDWVSELYLRHLLPLRSVLERLEQAIDRCEHDREKALRELGRLRVLRWFVRELDLDRDPSFKPRKDVLADRVESLWEATLDAMHDPAGTVNNQNAQDRKTSSVELTNRLLDPRFGELVQKAFLSFDREVDSEWTKLLSRSPRVQGLATMKELVVWVVHRAIITLSIVLDPSANDARAFFDSIDAAIKGMGKATKDGLGQGTALQRILSVVGSRFVNEHFETVLKEGEPLTYKLSDFGECSVDAAPSPVLQTPFRLALSAIAIRAAVEVHRLSPESRGVARELKAALVKSANLRESDARDFEAALSARFEGEPSNHIAEWGRRVEASIKVGEVTMAVKSPLLSGVMPCLRLTAIFFIMAEVEGEGDRVKASLQIVDHAANKTKEIIEGLEALHKSAKKILVGLAVVASVASIVAGFMTFAEGLKRGDRAMIFSGVLQVAGSSMTLVGVLFVTLDVLTIAGALVNMLAFIVSLLKLHATRRGKVLELFSQLTEAKDAEAEAKEAKDEAKDAEAEAKEAKDEAKQKWFVRLSQKKPELLVWYAAVKKAAEAISVDPVPGIPILQTILDEDFPPIRYSPRNVAILARLGVDQIDVAVLMDRRIYERHIYLDYQDAMKKGDLMPLGDDDD